MQSIQSWIFLLLLLLLLCFNSESALVFYVLVCVTLALSVHPVGHSHIFIKITKINKKIKILVHPPQKNKPQL